MKWFLLDHGIVSLEARKRALVSGLLDGMGYLCNEFTDCMLRVDVCVIESLRDDRVGGRLWKYKDKEV